MRPMTQAEKKEFIVSFMDSVKTELLGKVDKMPEEWNGFELRQIVADKFDFETRGYGGARKMDRRRMKAYTNEVICRNI